MGGGGEARRGGSLSMHDTGVADEETEEEAGTNRMVQYAVGVEHRIPHLMPLLLIPASASNYLSFEATD